MVLPPGIAMIFLVAVILSATGCSALRQRPVVTSTALRTAIPTGRHTPWPSPTYRPAPPSTTPTPSPTVPPASPLAATLALTWTIPLTSTPIWAAPLPGDVALPLRATLALSETLGLAATGAPALVLLTDTGTPAGETAAAEGTGTLQPALAVTGTGTPLAETAVSATVQTTITFSATLTATSAGFAATQPLTSTIMPAGPVDTPPPIVPTPIVWHVTAVAGLAPTPISTPSLTPIPTATPTFTPEPDPGLCIPAGQPVYGIVRWVIDGGTLQIEFNGLRRNVRLLGIAAPVVQPPAEFMGLAAKDRLTKLAQGRVVRMVSDPLVDHDENGLLLRYVSVESGPFLNFSMLRQGLAKSLLQPPGLDCEATLTQAEADAQAEMLGIWGQ
jgi:endonuclease YncB( thermonuclease family)